MLTAPIPATRHRRDVACPSTCQLISSPTRAARRQSWREQPRALELLVEGIERAGPTPGRDAGVAIDVAATQLFSQGRYLFRAEGRALTAVELVAELREWCDLYPIVSIEDAFAEDDWDRWQLRSAVFGRHRQLLGDDLFATNRQKGIRWAC